MGAELPQQGVPDGDEPSPQGFGEAGGEPQEEALEHDGFGQADLEAYFAAAAQRDDADFLQLAKQIEDALRIRARHIGLGGDVITNQVIDDIARLLGNRDAA